MENKAERGGRWKYSKGMRLMGGRRRGKRREGHWNMNEEDGKEKGEGNEEWMMMGEMRRRVLVLRKVSFQKEYTIQLYRINYSFSKL